MLLASNGKSQEMLLNVLKCTGEPPLQSIIQHKISTVRRSRNRGVGERVMDKRY